MTTNTSSICDTQTVIFDNKNYTISGQLLRKFGFLSGMLDSGLFDILELPLPQQPIIAKIGHCLLRFLMNNPDKGLNYLHYEVLEGLNNNEFIKTLLNANQNNTINIAKLRDTLSQVFGLLALADYWDCQVIIKDCADFLSLCLSVADTQSIKEWVSGII